MPSLNKRRRSLKNKKRRRGGRIPAVAVSNVAIKIPDLGNNSIPTSSPTEDDYSLKSFTDNAKELSNQTSSPTEDHYSLKSFIDMAEKLSVKFPSDEVLNGKINANPKTDRDNAINLTSRLYSKIKDAQDFDTIISGFGDLAVDEVEKVIKENDIKPPKAWTTDFNVLKDKLVIARNMNTEDDESVLNTLKELFPYSKFKNEGIHKLTPQEIKVSGEPPNMFKEFIMRDQSGGGKSRSNSKRKSKRMSKRKSKRKGGRSKNKNKTKRKSKRKSGGNGRLNIWGAPGRGETSRFSIIFWILVYFFTICSAFFMLITTFRIQPGAQPLGDTLVSVFDHGPTSREAGMATARAGLAYTFTYAHHALDMIVHFAFGRRPMRYVTDTMGWSAVSHAFLNDNNRLMSNALNRMSTLIIDWSLYLLMGVIYVVYSIRSIRANPEEKQQINRNLMKWLTMISLIKTILRVCWGLLLRQAAYNSQPDLALSLLQRVMGWWGSSHDLWLNVDGIVTWDAAIMMPISYFLLQGRSLQEYLGVGTVGALRGPRMPQLGYGSGGGGGGSGTPQLPPDSDTWTQDKLQQWFWKHYPMGNR